MLPRQRAALLTPRSRQGRVAIAVLCGLLGFGLAVQVRSTRADPTSRSREQDLVRVLDDLSGRSERLRSEIDTLRAARDRLESGTDRGRAALDEARRRANQLGVLAGTVPANGSGVVLTVRDPDGGVQADVVLDAIEELRDAGAEALQLDGVSGRVRVVASTYFLDDPAGGLVVDGTPVTPPYLITALGDAATLAAAVDIPGGVVDTVAAQGGVADVRTEEQIQVTALRRLSPPRYARPAPRPSGSS